MDRNSEFRLKLVNPRLSALIHQLAEILLAKYKVEIRVTQGIRSWAEQDDLANKVPPVTKARGGHSWHNFGLAVDVVPDDISIAGFQCDWNLSHPVWQWIHKEAEALGLTCGADFRAFPDWPHLQLTGRFPASPTDEVRSIFKCGGAVAVWQESGIK